MRFRPCIDIHNGRVKQIVGSSLRDEGDSAKDNFVSEQDGAFYADLYRRYGLSGGHVIILNPVGSEHYEADLEQARRALGTFSGGLQLGGGVTPDNAQMFLEMGASQVIVTSYVFKDGRADMERLEKLTALVGKEHLTLDLSCKKTPEGEYFVVTDRWQKMTELRFCEETLEKLSGCCAEFLVHAADVEGKQHGIEEEVARICGSSPIPCTYAGGIASMEDIELLRKCGGGKVDFTVGSALDLFGGKLSFEELAGIK